MNTLKIRGGQEVHVAEQHLWLHPCRAAYWVEERALLLADLHLGKATHFQRSGISVPVDVSYENWDRLIAVLLDFRPDRVLILGDLFHSEYNADWEDFSALTHQFSEVSFELIKGNHDILSEQAYQAAQLTLHEEPLEIGGWLLSHHPMEDVPEGQYNLAGHIHPGVVLSGSGRQRMRLPCFWFGERQGLLPAFGAFTGTSNVQPKAGDQVFVLAQEQVVPVF